MVSDKMKKKIDLVTEKLSDYSVNNIDDNKILEYLLMVELKQELEAI